MDFDVKNYFNNFKRDEHWNKNKDKFKRFFNKKLLELKVAIDIGTSEKDLKYDNYRSLGYLGIGTQAGLSLGVRTKNSRETNTILKDHVIGTVEIGKYIRSEYEKNNWNTEFMVNEWLYENLWIWSIIIVSKDEHNIKNILKAVNTMEEKRFLKHYVNVSDFYESKMNGKKII
jgi:hypothetical protein